MPSISWRLPSPESAGDLDLTGASVSTDRRVRWTQIVARHITQVTQEALDG